MQKHILMLATPAFILAYGATVATAQQGPMMQPQAQTQQPQQERPVQGVQSPRRSFEEDDTGITGWHHGLGWSRYGGHMGFGMMRGGGMMMRMLFAMMDSDGDGTVSLQEFQAAHERIFKAMDANKDGKLTLEEIGKELALESTQIRPSLQFSANDAILNSGRRPIHFAPESRLRLRPICILLPAYRHWSRLISPDFASGLFCSKSA